LLDQEENQLILPFKHNINITTFHHSFLNLWIKITPKETTHALQTIAEVVWSSQIHVPVETFYDEVSLHLNEIIVAITVTATFLN
jgi:hypothetical protein